MRTLACIVKLFFEPNLAIFEAQIITEPPVTTGSLFSDGIGGLSASGAPIVCGTNAKNTTDQCRYYDIKVSISLKIFGVESYCGHQLLHWKQIALRIYYDYYIQKVASAMERGPTLGPRLYLEEEGFEGPDNIKYWQLQISGLQGQTLNIQA